MDSILVQKFQNTPFFLFSSAINRSAIFGFWSKIFLQLFSKITLKWYDWLGLVDLILPLSLSLIIGKIIFFVSPMFWINLSIILNYYYYYYHIYKYVLCKWLLFFLTNDYLSPINRILLLLLFGVWYFGVPESIMIGQWSGWWWWLCFFLYILLNNKL